MSHPRYVNGAALLPDGRVLVAGGWYATSNSDPSHETAEIYDPAANRWTGTGSMKNARAEYGLVALNERSVLSDSYLCEFRGHTAVGVQAVRGGSGQDRAWYRLFRRDWMRSSETPMKRPPDYVHPAGLVRWL